MNRNFQQQYLRAAAARLGLTQKQLAQQMGVSLQTLEKWLAPEQSSNFRPMPTIAWKMVRTVLEVHLLKRQRLTNPPVGGKVRGMQAHQPEETTSNRHQLIMDHLLAHGISNLEDAPDELLHEAHEKADEILGKGNDD